MAIFGKDNPILSAGRHAIDGIRSHELLGYLGPAFLVTVGFIDPGNWATNIAGGSDFGYTLLWVITLSTIILILFQSLAARLGIVTELSLAQNVRLYFKRPVANALGVTAIIANSATDLAEFLGAAIGLNILFHIPIPIAAVISGLLVFGLVGLQQKHGFHLIEHLILVFISIIGFCYVVELYLVKPDWLAAARSSVVPSINSKSIYIAMGMLGAVIMPHNIYLHSDVIQHRDWSGTEARKEKLFRFELADTVLAMGAGWMINCAMIVVAAAVFFFRGMHITSIQQAAATLTPLVGGLSSLLFAIALLASGLSSSMTATLASVSVVTGYLGRDVNFIASRIVTMSPALIVIAIWPRNAFELMILSQVILSLQLPFTMVPLLLLTSSRDVMGRYASRPIVQAIGWVFSMIIIGLNFLLLVQVFGGRF